MPTRLGISAQATARLLRSRWIVVGLVAAGAAVATGGRGDWNDFVAVGRQLTGNAGLHVYVQNPGTQTGPLSLLLARAIATTPLDGFLLQVVLCLGLGMVVVVTTERAGVRVGVPVRNGQFTTLLGGSVLMVWWGELGGFGHLDDAIAIAAGVAATVLMQRPRRHPWASAVMIGVGAAAKPWAVLFLPLVLVGVVDGRRVRWRGLGPFAAACVACAVVWLPFVLADRGTLQSLHPQVFVAPDSVLTLFGSTSAEFAPGWLRAAQFAAALAVGVVLVARRRSFGLVLAVLAVRLATDPGTWSYYTCGLVAGALLWDQAAARRRLPWATLLASVLVAPSWFGLPDRVQAVMRFGAALFAIAIVLAGRADAQPMSGLPEDVAP